MHALHLVRGAPRSTRQEYSWRPQLELIEGRQLPGATFGLTLLTPLGVFAEPWAAAERQSPARPSSDLAVSAVPVPSLGMEADAGPPRTDLAGAPPLAVTTVFAALSQERAEVWLNAIGGFSTQGQTGSLFGIVTKRVCRPDPPFGFETRPAAGVDVWLEDLAVFTTGDDGSYGFEDVLVGTYTVGVFVDTFGVAREIIEIRPDTLTKQDLHIPAIIAGQMLVQFRNGVPQEEIDALNEAYGVTVLNMVGRIYVLEVPAWTFADDYVEAYSQEPIVDFAERHTFRCPGG